VEDKEAQGDVVDVDSRSEEVYIAEGVMAMLKRYFLTAALGLWCLSGCGGEGAGPSDTGRIFVRNDSKATVDVTAFVHGGQGEIRTSVEPGEVKDVTQMDLKNGTPVKLHLKARKSPDDPRGWHHFQPEATVEITVRGNVTIRVTGPLMFGKPLPYEIM